jgi:hypothetical protein
VDTGVELLEQLVVGPAVTHLPTVRRARHPAGRGGTDTGVDDNERLGPPEPLTDAELSALALAADPDAVLDSDAVPLAVVLGTDSPAALPSWYMPAPMSGS